MNQLDPSEDLLRQILTGERSLEDAEVRRLLDAQPHLRARLSRLTALASGLESEGAEQRQVLAASAGGPDPDLPMPDIGVALRARRTRRRVLLAAAALLIAIGGASAWWLQRPAPLAVPEQRLGDDWLCTATTAAGVLTLSWHDPRGPLRPDERYRLDVYRDPADAEPTWRLDAGTSPTWTATPGQERLPETFHYEVVVVGADTVVRRRSSLAQR